MQLNENETIAIKMSTTWKNGKPEKIQQENWLKLLLITIQPANWMKN